MSAPVHSLALFSEQHSGTMRLIGFLALASALMATDHRTELMTSLRHYASSLVAPAYWLATAPIRLGREARDAAAERAQLVTENAKLREQLLHAEAGLAQFNSMQEENSRLRELLDARERWNLQARLAELIEVDLDPYRHRLLIDQGIKAGIGSGQVVIDAYGLIGQIQRPDAERAEVILITDPGHAVPVRVVRNGLRAIANGTGDTDRLELPHIPFSADIVAGDELVTSGLGGRFPAGIPVAIVKQVRGDDSATFAIAEATPLAGLTRSNQVLVLSQTETPSTTEGKIEFVGPPAAADQSP